MTSTDAESIVPSYIGKVRRAEKHIVELKEAIASYGGTNSTDRPYTMRKRPKTKRQRTNRWELHFTKNVVNTDVPLIAADAIYNLRSSLDHLISALVKSSDRSSVIFPVYFQSVWDSVVPGENSERTKARDRWASDIGKVPAAGAVAFLKKLQPPDNGGNSDVVDGLRVLNELSNKDRHQKLPLVAHGLKGVLINWELPDGSFQPGWVPPDAETFVEDGAEIQNVPHGAMYVESYGAPQIVIRGRPDGANGATRDIPLVPFVEDMAAHLRETVIPSLVPYLWKTPSG